MTSNQWLIFLPAAFLVAASPGAGNFLALNHGIRVGLKGAVLGLMGRMCAFPLLIIAVTLGLGAVLATSVIAFRILKWAGVAYLVWLAFRLWGSDAPPAREQSPLKASITGLACREFVVALTNPKAILLFTAFIPQFVQVSQPVARQLLDLGVAYICLEFITASGYAFAGSRLKSLSLGQRGARRLNRISAGFMASAAGWLATMKHAP